MGDVTMNDALISHNLTRHPGLLRYIKLSKTMQFFPIVFEWFDDQFIGTCVEAPANDAR